MIRTTSILKRTARSATAVGAGLLLASCATQRRPAPRPQPVLYNWYDDGIGGPVSVEINLTSQELTAYRGGREIGWSVVATGLEGHSTPDGKFRIMEKVVDKYSTLYGVIKTYDGFTINHDAKVGRDAVPPDCEFVPAPMPYWQRLTGYGIGMHAGPIPRPGEPASHGCIRLPREMAVHLFEVTEVGTPVTITH